MLAHKYGRCRSIFVNYRYKYCNHMSLLLVFIDKSLDDEEIEFFIHGVVDGSVEASQLGEQLIHSACS